MSGNIIAPDSASRSQFAPVSHNNANEVDYFLAGNKEIVMSVARITEISSTSPKSFEDAILKGIERSNSTLRNVKGAWVKDQEVMIEDGKPIAFKVILKVTFILDD